MPKHSKRYNELARSVDTKQVYEPAQALEMVKKTASAKFDETVDVAVRLGVDPRHGDQMIRGTTSLPYGTGKARRENPGARTRVQDGEEHVQQRDGYQDAAD